MKWKLNVFNKCFLAGMVDHHTGKVVPISWLKRDLTKAGIAIAGILLLLVLMVWVPASAAGAYEGTSELAGPGTVTVQVTPTEDATMTALNKEKLAEEVKQLQQANDRSFFQWLWVYGSILFSTFVVVGGGIFAFIRWLDDRQKERKRQDEERQANLQKQEKERFESLSSVIAGLGDEKEELRVGAAIMLRTIFLRPGYEQFYTQIFDLAVAHLRLLSTSHPSEDPDKPLPLTALRQALIVVFKEAFPRAQSQNKGSPESLNAADVQLDHAYLKGADLRQAWMSKASLRGADLSKADLEGANLEGATLSGADLSQADLVGANLKGANLKGANLKGANLKGANLKGANLKGASLNEAYLKEALSLEDTDLHGVNGLTKEQLAAYKAKGAITDGDSTTSSSQSIVSPPPPESRNDAQVQSAPPAQESISPADTGGSNAASTQREPEL